MPDRVRGARALALASFVLLAPSVLVTASVVSADEAQVPAGERREVSHDPWARSIPIPAERGTPAAAPPRISQAATRSTAAATNQAPALDERVPVKAERVLVLKRERRILLIEGERVLSEYRIALGSQPEGPKRQVGDGRTPEGRYRLDWRKEDSEYYRAIHISYPDDDDEHRARASGVDPGGAIMIHGLPNGLGIIGEHHARQDWTDGCIAVTNEEMDEIWERVDDGTTIEIHP